MRWVFVIAGLCLLAASPGDAATSPSEVLDDAELEQRARALGKELRCLVCQNQSIDDSDAELARDLRLIVREQLVDGKTDQQIKDYMVDRYGAFVLLKPPVSPSTWFLWVGPFAVLMVAAWFVWRSRVRLGTDDAAVVIQEPLSDAERAELNGVLESTDGKPH